MKQKPPLQILNDPELMAHAICFVKKFYEAVGRSLKNGPMASGSGISIGEAGIVEIDSDLASTQFHLCKRSEIALGSKRSHQRAINRTILKQAHASVAANQDVNVAAKKIIAAILSEASQSYRYAASNMLIELGSGIHSLNIGKVQIMTASQLDRLRRNETPDLKYQIHQSSRDDEGIMPSSDGSIVFGIHHTCWVVDADAVLENMEEEALWLIDVAISLLRLSVKNWGSGVPIVGDIEPHPILAHSGEHEGITFNEKKFSAGGYTCPNLYHVDLDVVALTAREDFKVKANLLFTPPAKSVAERVAQGLGWLTRGRRSNDRAERLLFFFTAIEALLSSSDKTAPVVQTIVRHAGVMLSDDNEDRARHASDLKRLYGLRSSLVHAGQRGVDWTAAKKAQEFAEALFMVALEKADLKSKHETFNASLAMASYGIEWKS